MAINAKSDNEPALTNLVESWRTLRAMERVSRMIIETSPLDSSKSNGIVERAIQSVQGTIRSASEETWVAEKVGFLLTRFEVGRDWEDSTRETERNSGKVQKRVTGLKGILWRSRRSIVGH